MGKQHAYTQRLHGNFNVPRASWDAAGGTHPQARPAPRMPGAWGQRASWHRSGRRSGNAPSPPCRLQPARHTSCAYQYPHQTAAEGRPVTSPSSVASGRPVRHAGEDAETRLLPAPKASTGAWAGVPGSAPPPALPRWGLSQPRVPAPGKNRPGTITQLQPLTFSWVQAAAPRLTPQVSRGRAATSSSRWRVPTTLRSPSPAISRRVCERRFPGLLAVTSPGTRFLRLPSSPPLGRLRPPPHSHRLPVASPLRCAG